MGVVMMNPSGGGGAGSDELTATAENVVQNLTYVGADTNDEAGIGTLPVMPNSTAVTPSGGTGNEILALPRGVYEGVTVNRTGPYNAGNSAGYTMGYNAGVAANGRVAYQYYNAGNWGGVSCVWTAARAGEKLVVVGIGPNYAFSAAANSGTKLVSGPAAGNGMRGYVFEATRTGPVSVAVYSTADGSVCMAFRVY